MLVALRRGERPAAAGRRLRAERRLEVPDPADAPHLHRTTREELLERAGAVLGWVADGKLDVLIGGTLPARGGAARAGGSRGAPDDRQAAPDRVRRVRFAPSPTGTLHIGNALSAVANRRFGDWMLLRIDDTDAARNVAGGEEAILEDLAGSASTGTRGPARQCERRSATARPRSRSAMTRLDGVTLVREDGTADLPARDRRRRRRLRDHARRSAATTTGRTRRCTGGSRGARRRAARVRPPRADPRRGRQEALEARRGRDRRRRCARPGSPPRPCARTSRSSAFRGTTSTTTSPRIRRLAIEAIGALSGRRAGSARAGAASRRAGAARAPAT